jgi:non-ribosomal peptide synthetase component F
MTNGELLAESTVVDLIRERAAASPASVAVELISLDSTIALSYAELLSKADAGAALIASRVRVGPGVIIAQCVPDGPECAISLLSILFTASAFTPVDLAQPEERIRYQLLDAACEAILCHAADAPHVRRILGSETSIVVLDVAELLVCAPAATENRAVPRASDLCWVYYTSGTTGRPKGVLVEHAAAANYARYHPLLSIRTDVDSVRMLCASAFTFDPFVGDLFGCLCTGATFCLAPRRLVLADFDALLVQSRATHACSTPAVWGRIALHQMKWLRVLGLGGEVISAALLAQWWPWLEVSRTRLFNMYGTTECTVYQVSSPPLWNCCGAPFSNRSSCAAVRCYCCWQCAVPPHSSGSIVGKLRIAAGHP